MPWLLESHRWERRIIIFIIIIIVSSTRRQLPYLANMAESGRYSAAAHSSGRGTALNFRLFDSRSLNAVSIYS